jgi:hypothetical protein
MNHATEANPPNGQGPSLSIEANTRRVFPGGQLVKTASNLIFFLFSQLLRPGHPSSVRLFHSALFQQYPFIYLFHLGRLLFFVNVSALPQEMLYTILSLCLLSLLSAGSRDAVLNRQRLWGRML